MWQKNDEFLPVFITSHIQHLCLHAKPILCYIICKHSDLLLLSVFEIFITLAESVPQNGHRACYAIGERTRHILMELLTFSSPSTAIQRFPSHHGENKPAKTAESGRTRAPGERSTPARLHKAFLLGSRPSPLEIHNNAGCKSRKCCNSLILSRFHFECACDSRLEYKLILKLIIVHSPQGVLPGCLFNYIFNRFPAKQIQKVTVYEDSVQQFKFTN